MIFKADFLFRFSILTNPFLDNSTSCFYFCECLTMVALTLESICIAFSILCFAFSFLVFRPFGFLSPFPFREVVHLFVAPCL
jgi:hypothetical protein